MKPSPEFRRILTESAEPHKIFERLKKILETRHDDKSKEISEKLNTYQEIIEKLQKEWEYLNEHYADISDEEFEERYQKVNREINLILEMILGHRQYTVEFVDISSIKNLREFVEKGPMYFIPRKKEIGRILALALQMHRERIEKGEKGEDEPIRILDIGGGNGSLGHLITSLAIENNLKIEYIVVDPDSSTVQKAAEFYKENPSLIFIEKRGEDFIEELYKDDSEIYPLIIKRRALIEEGERIRERLNILRKRIYNEEGRLTKDKICKYIKILKEDFGIEMDERYYTSRPSHYFVNALSEGRIDETSVCGYMGFDDVYLERYRNEINALTEEIQRIIARRPTKYDLVICSWMPPNVDLTNTVKEANGASILHIIEWYGATGCQFRGVPFPSSYPRLGQGESYQPGPYYKSRFGWIGYSTPEIKFALVFEIKAFWENWHDEMVAGSRTNILYGTSFKINPYSGGLVKPLSNGFIIQTKVGYKETGLTLNPKEVGIKVKGIYPWERQLMAYGGDISPIIELKDEEGILEYFFYFEDLLEKLQEEFNSRKQVKRRKRTQNI